MSVFIKGLLACSAGPLKSSLRISSFGFHLLLWRSKISGGQNFKCGGPANLKISSGGAYAPSIPTVEVSEVALRRTKTQFAIINSIEFPPS